MANSRRFAVLWTAVAVAGVGALYSLAALVHGSQPFTPGPVQPLPWFAALAFFALCFGVGLVAIALAHRRARQNDAVAN